MTRTGVCIIALKQDSECSEEGSRFEEAITGSVLLYCAFDRWFDGVGTDSHI